MKHFEKDTLDRAQALGLATSVCRRGAQELSALAATNPELLADWPYELIQYRNCARDEAHRLTAVVDFIRIALRAPSREAP